MFNPKISRLIILFSFILLFVFVSMVYAAGETVTINSHNTTDCAPGALINGSVTHNNGTAGTTLRFSLSNNTQGTNYTFTAGIQPSGTHPYYIVVPAASAGGDSMSMTIQILDAGAGVLASDTFNYNCPPAGPLPPGPPAPGPGTGSNIPTVPAVQPAFHDGRINAWDTGNPVVLYGMGDGDSRRLDVYEADGSGLVVSIPANAIDVVDDCPDSNTLIFKDDVNGVSLWRLAERNIGSDNADICPFQLSAPTVDTGKNYIVVFDGLYSNTYYESWEE